MFSRAVWRLALRLCHTQSTKWHYAPTSIPDFPGLVAKAYSTPLRSGRHSFSHGLPIMGGGLMAWLIGITLRPTPGDVLGWSAASQALGASLEISWGCSGARGFPRVARCTPIPKELNTVGAILFKSDPMCK